MSLNRVRMDTKTSNKLQNSGNKNGEAQQKLRQQIWT